MFKHLKFQSFIFRGHGKGYLDLIAGIAVEEISHVELISKTISKLLDGAPEYTGKKFGVPGQGGVATMNMAKEQKNLIILLWAHKRRCPWTPPGIHGVEVTFTATGIWFWIC